MSLRRTAAAGAIAIATALALGAPTAQAAVDPPSCTPDVQFDPTIPTWTDVNGDSLAGTNATGTASRHPTQKLYDYQQALATATASNPRVKVIVKDIGETVLGTFDVPGQERRLKYAVVGTPENIDNLDAGRNDGAFWSGVASGSVPPATAQAEVRKRPAFVWATATPHGNEPAAGEALMRQLYELVARTDCANLRRLAALDVFIDPARNPDGRDNNVRVTAWGYDPNRDFGTRNQPENRQFMPEITKYPGLFFIDAHQQTSGYFFPPNQDPVHAEISDFSLDLINNKIGAALQKEFNSQTSAYQNYNTYDMFAPVFGDSVPSLIMNSAGMTYEKGSSEGYGKQVYDHYLAIDETINLVADQKVELLGNWIGTWQEAIDQGLSCELQENKLVSPVNLGGITQQPRGNVCGYYYKPDVHSGDAARVLTEMIETGVEVYKLDQGVTGVTGAHRFGTAEGVTETTDLPAGSYWIPSAQPQKHWLQAVLGEDPFIPFPYYYDVVSWSYNLNRVGAGNGMLTQNLPANTPMTRVTAIESGTAPAANQSVYAFNTDSMQAVAMIAELIEDGATVYRGKTAFTEGGREFRTGAALVDGATVKANDINLALLSSQRDTPITPLASYPVARYLVKTPKIGLYTGGATEPTNPIRPGTGTGHCASSTYCSALFVLTQKDRVPSSMITPITSTQLAAGELVSGNYTAFINGGSTIAAGAGATAVQTFVNGGGVYVGTAAGGITSARNAGISTANTVASGTTCPSTSVLTNNTTCFGTPGTTFVADFDTTSPVAWGHDLGGFVYRDGSGNPLIDTDTLDDGAPTIPAATPAVKFGASPIAFGFERNAATGDKKLANRTAVVDQPFGAGRAVLIASDPFYRAWHEGAERVLLNAALYPVGAELPAGPGPVITRAAPAAGAAPAAPAAKAALPVAEPVPAAKLPEVASRPVFKTPDNSKDVFIEVRKYDGAALRKAVKAAKLAKSLSKRSSFIAGKRTVTFYVRRGAEEGGHRPHWVSRVMGELTRRKVKPTQAKLG